MDTVLEDRQTGSPNEGRGGSVMGLYRRHSLLAPVVLITLGLMFLAAEFFPQWSLGRTWPILLVEIGVLKLIEAGRPPRPPAGPRI